jgi:hypothetical protein
MGCTRGVYVEEEEEEDEEEEEETVVYVLTELSIIRTQP